MSVSRLAIAAACLFAAACTSGKDEPQAFEGRLAGASELRCDESDLVEPSEGQEVAGGVVLASTYKAEEAGREDGLKFAKGGLWVKGDSRVRLTVVSPLGTLLSWGKPGRPAPQVVVPPCEGSKWRVWPGGFYVNGPSTVDLLVETAQEKVTVTVAIG